MKTSSLLRIGKPLARAFPPPAYLTYPAVGIDISDYAIKYILFSSHEARLPLRAFGKIDLPLDVIEHGEIRDTTTIARHLNTLREEHNIKYAHLSLPEEHAYLFQIDLEVQPGEDIQQMLEFHFKEHVPLGAEEAVYDYNVLRTRGATTTLNVSVYPMAIANQYIQAVEESGIHVLSAEIEGQATMRALLDNDTKNATLVVDIGRNDSNLSISTNGTVTFTASLEVGGDDLTRAIARGLDVSFQKAEQLKRKHGFSDTEETELVFRALSTPIEGLAEEIRRHLLYWQMHMKNAKGESEEIARIILAGGSANMRGLPDYLRATLGTPVEVGTVWKNVTLEEGDVPEIPIALSLEYAAAIGLALRSTHQHR